MEATDNNSSASPRSKKVYATPSLQVYGNIRALTNAVSMNTALDGMATGNTKTM